MCFDLAQGSHQTRAKHIKIMFHCQDIQHISQPIEQPASTRNWLVLIKKSLLQNNAISNLFSFFFIFTFSNWYLCCGYYSDSARVQNTLIIIMLKVDFRMARSKRSSICPVFYCSTTFGCLPENEQLLICCRD